MLQEVIIQEKTSTLADNMDNKALKIIRRNEEMRGARNVNDSLMRDIAQHVQPRKADGILSDSSVTPTDAAESLRDTTAMNANQTLASGLHSHISPMGSSFVTLGAPEVGEKGGYGYEVEQFFHRSTKTLHAKLTESNFHSAADEFYLDHGGFGTAAMLCRMGKKGKLVFEALEIGSYSIAEGEDRTVNTLYREYEMTPRQILERFGEEVPSLVKEKAKDEKSKDIALKIIHAIEPREDYDENKIDDRNMPFASVYVLCEAKQVLHESGFYEQPFSVSRWRLWGKSPWGWSPSYYALPVANQLNFLEMCVDVGVERAAFPAWMIPNTMKGEFDPRPYGQNIFDASGAGDDSLPHELQSTGRIDIAMDRMEQKRQVIREAFFEDLFRLLSRVEKTITARETEELVAEKSTQFHPFYARLTTEFLSVITYRAYAELLRDGAFGEPPEGLFTKVGEGWEMPNPKLEFNSRLGMALEMNEVAGILNTIDDLNPMAQIVGAQVYDWLNDAKLGVAIARARGVSPDVMRSSEEIEAVKKQRAEAEQQAMQMEQAQQMAGAVNSLGGVSAAQQAMEG